MIHLMQKSFLHSPFKAPQRCPSLVTVNRFLPLAPPLCQAINGGVILLLVVRPRTAATPPPPDQSVCCKSSAKVLRKTDSHGFNALECAYLHEKDCGPVAVAFVGSSGAEEVVGCCKGD